MSLVYLTCTGSVLNTSETPEMAPVISPESTFLGINSLGGGVYNPVLTKLSRASRGEVAGNP